MVGYVADVALFGIGIVIEIEVEPWLACGCVFGICFQFNFMGINHRCPI